MKWLGMSREGCALHCIAARRRRRRVSMNLTFFPRTSFWHFLQGMELQPNTGPYRSVWVSVAFTKTFPSIDRLAA